MMTYLLFILIVLGLEVLVAALIWVWWNSLKNQQKQYQSASQDTYARLATIIEETSHEAQKALTASLQKADELQKQTEKHAQDMATNAQQLMKKQGEWQEITNEKLWLAYQETLNLETKNASQKLAQIVTEQANGLSDQVAETLAVTTKDITSQLATELQKAEAEIAQYKESEIQRIHEASQSLATKIASDIIGLELKPADHHQLVAAQLTKALNTLKK